MTSIPHLTLNDGHSLPQLGLGLYNVPANETARLIQSAAQIGYQSFDGAPIYGNEQEMGTGAAALEGQIHLTTKLWLTELGHDRAIAAFNQSLINLHRDDVNLYLIHWPQPRLDLYVETWRALIELRSERRALSIGVSNFNIEHLQQLIDETGVVPAVNQVELHPHFQQRELREFHQRHGIVTQSWSPLGRGSLFEEPLIRQLALEHDRTPAQIILRWHFQLGLAAMPKTKSSHRLRENIAIYDFSLSDGEMSQLGALDRSDGRMGPNPLHT